MSDHRQKGQRVTRKFMDLAEFREQGYLQEVNRQFFHPLGLALVWKKDDDGNVTLAGVWDSRDDPEGWYMDTSRRDEFGADEARRAAFVAAEREKREANRIRAFGWIVQPVDDGGLVAPVPYEPVSRDERQEDEH